MDNINLSKISVQQFVNLIGNLDQTDVGENLFLRCYPDGGSYISNDLGKVDYEFRNFEELINFLMEK